VNAPDPANARDTLARTIWGEARGEASGGMEAVASVILNRAAHPRWWGKDVSGVCLKPYQFSCWLENDPNRPKMLAVDEKTDAPFARALAIADSALAGTLHDATGGADSYADLRVCSPPWAKTARQTAQIGHHTFFKVELP
jgi:N-acetylmuramoyl-L-alanine amidase